MLSQEVIEFVMGHITNPNKENAIRMPLADFAFIPEAEAGVIEDADAKFHNVDVLPAGGGAEGCPDKPFYPARSSGAIHTSGLRDPVRGVLQDIPCQACQDSRQRFSGYMEQVDPYLYR